jgi:hypothetical protein
MMNTAIGNAPEELFDSVPAQKNVGDIERVASVLVGSFLLFSIFRGSLKLLSPGTKIGLSSYLIHRGITGHCRVYDSIGVSSVANSDRAEADAMIDPIP